MEMMWLSIWVVVLVKSGPLSKEVEVSCMGVDINPKFIEHCKARYSDVEFTTLNLLHIEEFWTETKKRGFQNPLFICCNNTFSILPVEVRKPLFSSIRKLVANDKQNIFFTFWNGEFFRHAIDNYYQKNPELCGRFDDSDVNYDERHLETPSGYCTTWFLAEEIDSMLKDCNESCSSTYSISKCESGIFVWM